MTKTFYIWFWSSNTGRRLGTGERALGLPRRALAPRPERGSFGQRGCVCVCDRVSEREKKKSGVVELLLLRCYTTMSPFCDGGKS
jgi:hypothetical protein